MIWRTRLEQIRVRREAGDRDHGHHHNPDGHRIDTGNGVLSLELFEDGAPPRWCIRKERGPGWRARAVTIETERPDGSRTTFGFANHGDYLESIEVIPGPHEFTPRVIAGAWRTHAPL